MPEAVGIIANPQSGKDARRIAADATVMNNHDKVAIVRRLLRAMDRFAVKKVFVMPDEFGIGYRALDSYGHMVEILDMEISGSAADSQRAAEALRGQVACLITIGGDGTNRAVASASGDTPILAISTGTNNVFPSHVDGTIAGIAASGLAKGFLDPSDVCWRSKRIIATAGSSVDVALVDAAVTTEPFTGAKAIWDIRTVRYLLVTQAEPFNLGLSSIAGILQPVGRHEPWGLEVELNEPGQTLLAPLAPGLLTPVAVKRWAQVPLGYRWTWKANHPGTLALDGEREMPFLAGQPLSLQLDHHGPLVVDPFRAVVQMAKTGHLRLG